MSEDLNKKVKQIADMLSQENLPDNLKSLLSLLAGSGGGEESSPKTKEPLQAKEEGLERSNLEDNIDMMRKIKKIMDRLNSSNDPRINLLSALKPFLNSRRQKKLNSCINMLRMSRLAKLFEDYEKGGF